MARAPALILVCTLSAVACGDDAEPRDVRSDTTAETNGAEVDATAVPDTVADVEEVTADTVTLSDGEDASADVAVESDGDDTAVDTEDTTDAPEIIGPQDTLARVRARGALRCGVNAGLRGFGLVQGESATGFDIDFCRAVATAVLGDASALELVPLSGAQRFPALLNGDIDVLIRNTTWTQGRDVAFDFGPTTFYDGQKLMGTAPTFGADSLITDSDGARVCVVANSTGAENIQSVAADAGITLSLEPAADVATAMSMLLAGDCDLFTTDESSLVSARFDAAGAGGDELVIFPATPLSKEPLGPVYRSGDSRWADVVDWVVYAMLIADDKGITSADIDERWDLDPGSTALFGGAGERQSAMGLAADAFREVIAQVGNYDEVYAANLAPLGFARAGTLNARYGVEGGLLFAPPPGGSVPADLVAAPVPSQSTLALVRERGRLRCGVNGGLAGFSLIQGEAASGFDVDFCRAIATAALGDPMAVDFMPLTSAQRFNSLAQGDVDVLVRNTTRTQGRETVFDFAPTTFHDGQKLLGPASAFAPESTIADIDGQTVCAIAGTTGADNVQNAAAASGVTITLLTVTDQAEASAKLLAGDCALFTTDESALMSLRANLDGGGPGLVIFPYVPISKEPLGPVYRANDPVWADVVNWTVYAMFTADHLGITSLNIDATWSDTPESTALFGGQGERQSAMGLAADALRKVISEVGNYGEVFTTHLGPLGFARENGANARYGPERGLIFSPPAGGSIPQ